MSIAGNADEYLPDHKDDTFAVFRRRGDQVKLFVAALGKLYQIIMKLGERIGYIFGVIILGEVEKSFLHVVIKDAVYAFLFIQRMLFERIAPFLLRLRLQLLPAPVNNVIEAQAPLCLIFWHNI